MSKILVVDDEVQIRTLLSRMLELEGYEVCQAGDCRTALKQLEFQSPDVVLCDVFLPDGNGVDLVSSVKKTTPNVEIILLTAHGNIPDGVQAIKNGAFDYITKGDDNNKIIPLVSRAVEKARMNVRLEKLEKKVGHTYSFDSVLGDSKALKDAVSLARKVSGTDVPVLLTGETGTGKEVFAQAIHYNSKRAKQNFVAVNCSSFSKELLESEMFGHKAGSFTGALKDKKGWFEEADNGTIFLDEIGEMPQTLQSKLLRVLQEQEFERIGGINTIKVNVRIICCTNQDLQQLIQAKHFRSDLYYRINTVELKIPPLRNRKKDIAELTDYFIQKYNAEHDTHVISIDTDVLQLFQTYDWPGNVRELEHIVERLCTINNNRTITMKSCGFLQELVQQSVHANPDGSASALTPSGLQTPLSTAPNISAAQSKVPISTSSQTSELSWNDLSRKIQNTEKEAIIQALLQTNGNKAKAARLLNIDRSSLYYKLKKYNITE